MQLASFINLTIFESEEFNEYEQQFPPDGYPHYMQFFHMKMNKYLNEHSKYFINAEIIVEYFGILYILFNNVYKEARKINLRWVNFFCILKSSDLFYFFNRFISVENNGIFISMTDVISCLKKYFINHLKDRVAKYQMNRCDIHATYQNVSKSFIEKYGDLISPDDYDFLQRTHAIESVIDDISNTITDFSQIFKSSVFFNPWINFLRNYKYPNNSIINILDGSENGEYNLKMDIILQDLIECFSNPNKNTFTYNVNGENKFTSLKNKYENLNNLEMFIDLNFDDYQLLKDNVDHINDLIVILEDLAITEIFRNEYEELKRLIDDEDRKNDRQYCWVRLTEISKIVLDVYMNMSSEVLMK